MKWHEAPLLPLSAALALGIVLAAWATSAPGWLLAAGGLLLAVGACATAFGPDGTCESAATAVLLALAVVLGALRGATEQLPADHIARAKLASVVNVPVVKVEGRLAEEPVRWASGRTRLILDVDGFFDEADRRPASGRLQVTLYGETAAVGEGQRVSVELKLARPRGFRNPDAFDYPAFLRREGILLVGSGRAESLVPLTPDEPPWPVRVKRWAVAVIGAHLPETSAALLAGLILGEKTGLPAETDEAFRRAGVYHILAVSGFNVALLASSVFFVLASLGIPRRPTAVAATFSLVGFALVVGGQPSVLRATVMGLMLLLAVLLERESQLRHARLAALARLRRGRQPGRSACRHARHARPLQPALPGRCRRQSRRGASGRRRHHARHARAARRVRVRSGRGRPLPGALARALGLAPGRQGGGAPPRRARLPALARLGLHRGLVRGAGASPLPRREAMAPHRNGRARQSRPGPFALAMGAARRWQAA